MASPNTTRGQTEMALRKKDAKDKLQAALTAAEKKKPKL
jgi:hypothetical protein